MATNISFSVNLTNATNANNTNFTEECHNCTNVVFSSFCTDCFNCTNCTNCTNCANCTNVTNGLNAFNVEHSLNVTNVVNGSNLLNVTDSANVSFLTHAFNMTNSSNCTGCKNNYNCTGKICMVPRVDTTMQDIISAHIKNHSEMIIDRLYNLYHVGDPTRYRRHEELFDLSLYKANSDFLDFNSFFNFFTKGGMRLDYEVGSHFIQKDPTLLKQKAMVHLISKPKATVDINFKLEVDPQLNQKVIQLLNEEITLSFLFSWITDINKGILPFKYVHVPTSKELRAQVDYEKSLETEHAQNLKLDSSKVDKSTLKGEDQTETAEEGGEPTALENRILFKVDTVKIRIDSFKKKMLKRRQH